MRGIFTYCLMAGLVLALGLVNKARAENLDPQTPAVDFKHDIQPLFRRHCYRCHGQTKAEGGFRLTSRKAALGEGDSGELLISPKQPAQSLILSRLTDDSLGDVMPLDSEPLPKADLDLIKRWIEEGASWPDEAAEDRHWAYAAPARPALPKVQNAAWPKNAIDYFVLARLEEDGLTPSDPVERAG